jgi:hypothetical protein
MKRLFRLLPRILRKRVRIARTRRRVGIFRPNRVFFLDHKESARERVLELLGQYGGLYGLSWGQVRIKDHQSRWGSCSRLGNLNFNVRIALLPRHLAEYIVVHELCHLLHPHHQASFWSEVARAIPDHQSRRKELVVWSKHHHLSQTARSKDSISRVSDPVAKNREEGILAT